VRRLAIVRLGGPDDGVRRYRLARLDEIALASPPEKALPPEAEPVDDQPDHDALDRRSNRAA
jgi:hypothetical protein